MLRPYPAAAIAIATLSAALACGGEAAPATADAGLDAGPPGALELGMWDDATGAFVPVIDGMTVPVILGGNGLNMIVPSLRAEDVDPRGPEPTITVEVGGVLMAADLAGANIDMDPSTGAAYVLRNVQVAFQTALCCFDCSEAFVHAVLEDRSGRLFETEVTVVLAKGSCSEPVCCNEAGACPAPISPPLCQ